MKDVTLATYSFDNIPNLSLKKPKSKKKSYKKSSSSKKYLSKNVKSMSKVTHDMNISLAAASNNSFG